MKVGDFYEVTAELKVLAFIEEIILTTAQASDTSLILPLQRS